MSPFFLGPLDTIRDGRIELRTTTTNDSKRPKVSAMPGFAAVGLFVTGVAGIHHAYYSDSGLGLIAAALAFGVILVVSFL